MTRSGRTTRLALIAAAGMLVMISAAFEMSPIAPLLTLTQNSLPTDTSANHSCAVATSMFDSWFHSGTHTLNGLVDPANSLTFPNIPNCSFYQWSEQMFLWLTSPVGGNRQVFRTNTFFDVSPPDQTNGSRTFIPHPSPAVLGVEQGQTDLSVLEAQATAGGSLVYYLTTVNDIYAFLPPV